MKTAASLADRGLAAVVEPSASVTTTPPMHGEEDRSRPIPTDERCSVDPLAATDRYRLVTPLFLSSRDL
jgi:hypothetical protein